MHFWITILLLIVYIDSFSQKNTPQFYWQQANSLPSGQNLEKLALYKKAENLAQKQKKHAWQANIYPDICGAYFGLGDYENAINACRKGLKILSDRKIHNDSISFKLHSSLATCFNKTYRIGEALKEFDIANQIINKKPVIAKSSPLFAAFHFSNQAHLLLELFEIENAKVLYERALEISNTMHYKKHYALILGNLSQYYRFLGQPEKGIEKIEEAFRNVKDINALRAGEISNIYFMLGTFYQDIKKFRLAQRNFERSIFFASKDLKMKENIVRANISIARGYMEIEETSKSLKLLKSIKLEKKEDKENTYEYHLAFGDNYLKDNQLEESLDYYEEAFQVYFPKQRIYNIQPKNVVEHKFRLYEILGRISKVQELRYRNANHFESLIASYNLKKKIMDVGKSIREFQENLNSKLFFTDRYHKNYTEAIVLGYEILLKRPSDQLKTELFNLAEEAKSISLSDNMLLQNNTRDAQTDSLMSKLNAYQSYLSYLKNQSVKDMGQINDYELKTRNILNALKSTNSALYTTIYEEKTFFDKAVPKGVMYINYILSGSELYVFSKIQTKLSINKIKLNELEFKNNIKVLVNALQNQPHPLEGFSEQKKCEYFYKILLVSQQIDLDKVNRLIINPDNIFYGLSFDILKNPTNAKYLIETHAISYANNLHHALNNSLTPHRYSSQWVSFFPFSSTSQTLISGLKPLKFSLEEIKGILADVKKDAGASKEFFLESLTKEDNNVVMIATHADGNDSDPYLLFDDKNGVSSRLYASEIRQIKVTSPMVILSACETNKGKTWNGLGVLSFTKALSLSGCPAVVGTFWNVEDKSMSALASLFYRNLLKGMHKDVALQKAKLSFLQSEIGKQNDLPFYWAHLQVMGNTSPIAQSKTFTYIILSTITTLILLALYYFRQSLKRSFLTKVGS
jgi:CHAT domain-containing protein